MMKENPDNVSSTVKSGRSFDIQPDGSVHYWSRTMSAPVSLTAEQFASVGEANTRLFLSVAISLIVAVLTDGYLWAGEIDGATAIVILMALVSFNALFIAKVRNDRLAMLRDLPPAPADAKVKPPLSIAELFVAAAIVLSQKMARAPVWMLLVLGYASLLGVFAVGHTLMQLLEGVAFYWGKRNSLPVGPTIPAFALLVSLLLATWTACMIIARIGSRWRR
ncbi:hypothetical protein [Ensifer adhaerens]|nr:hypothetical protein [Ensifer adhaerens]